MLRRLLLAVLVAGCTPAPPSEHAEASASAEVAPEVSAVATGSASASAAVADSASPKAPEPIAQASTYPIGDDCADPKALANEGKTLAPRSQWDKLGSRTGRFKLEAPRGIFVSTDERDGFRLMSSLKAGTLGESAPRERFFAMRIQRFARSIDAILQDKAKSAPLQGAYFDEAFPQRTEKSFKPEADSSASSGSAQNITVAGKPAYRWVTGVEGYNTDYVLVHLADADTLLIVAPWNSSVMGQPECYQRMVVAGVVDSIAIE